MILSKSIINITIGYIYIYILLLLLLYIYIYIIIIIIIIISDEYHLLRTMHRAYYVKDRDTRPHGYLRKLCFVARTFLTSTSQYPFCASSECLDHCPAKRGEGSPSCRSACCTAAGSSAPSPPHSTTLIGHVQCPHRWHGVITGSAQVAWGPHRVGTGSAQGSWGQHRVCTGPEWG